MCLGKCVALFLTVFLGLAQGGMRGSTVQSSASARFEPDEIDSCGRSQLVLEIVGEGKAVEESPIAVDGLDLRRLRAVYQPSRSGSGTTTISYQVQPKREGTFILQSAMVQVAGQPIPIPPTRLTVLSPNAAVTQKGQLSSVARQVRLALGPLPEKIYENQTFPMEITLSAPPALRVRLGGAVPQKIGDAFHCGGSAGGALPAIVALETLDGSGENRWRTLLTPKVAGNVPLAFALGLSLEVQGKESILGKKGVWKGLENFFDGDSRWITVTVTTPQGNVPVLPLPREGRPADFSGAIGKFSLLPPRIQGSEPITAGNSVELIVPIQGQGNLNSIHTPNLLLGRQWKLHRTRKIVNPEDRLGHGGTVEFRYTLIAQEENAVLPPFQFSYFDPTTGSYGSLGHEFRSLSGKSDGTDELQPSLLLANLLPIRVGWNGATFGGQTAGDDRDVHLGDGALRAGDYAMAVNFYEGIPLERRTAAVLQNLAIAQVAVGEIGPGIVSLRRALLLEPSNETLRGALALLLQENELPPFRQSALENFSLRLSHDQWTAAGVASAVLFVLCGLRFLFHRGRKKFFAVAAAAAGLVWIFAVGSSRRLSVLHGEAIVLKNTVAYDIPSRRAPAVRYLPAGSSLHFLAVRGDLVSIFTADGGTYYVEKKDCEWIFPGGPDDLPPTANPGPRTEDGGTPPLPGGTPPPDAPSAGERTGDGPPAARNRTDSAEARPPTQRVHRSSARRPVQ